MLRCPRARQLFTVRSSEMTPQVFSLCTDVSGLNVTRGLKHELPVMKYFFTINIIPLKYRKSDFPSWSVCRQKCSRCAWISDRRGSLAAPSLIQYGNIVHDSVCSQLGSFCVIYTFKLSGIVPLSAGVWLTMLTTIIDASIMLFRVERYQLECQSQLQISNSEVNRASHTSARWLRLKSFVLFSVELPKVQNRYYDEL